MEANTKRAIMWGLGVGVGTAALYGLVVRPWHHRWGAEPIDVKRPMPGDDVVPDANDVTDRAIVIEAEPRDIWPWLVQMGYERGGMYSYDWLNEALGYIEGPSAEELHSEFQRLSEGDLIPLGRAGDLRVDALQRNHWMVLVPEDLPWGSASWSIMLYPFAPNRTRLICRTRTRFGWSPRDLFYRATLDPGAFLMFRKWFLGVKERAERTAALRRGQERLERRRHPQTEWRPRQRPIGTG